MHGPGVARSQVSVKPFAGGEHFRAQASPRKDNGTRQQKNINPQPRLMNMKTKTTLIVAGILALAALPSAFAEDANAKLKEKDTDGDGRVTRAEYSAGALMQFAKLDASGDGIISADEVSASSEKSTSKLKFWSKDDKASAQDMLSSCDQNNDGQVSRDEHRAGVERKFAELDTNGDGALTENELAARKK